jgi:hypothetical protein
VTVAAPGVHLDATRMAEAIPRLNCDGLFRTAPGEMPQDFWSEIFEYSIAVEPGFFVRSAERAWPDSPTAPGGARAILPTSCRHPLRHCGRNATVPKIIKGSKMVDHETRRKVIRQWMSLPKDKRQTPDQAADFARKAVEQNELQPSRRDPYERVVSWLLPRTGRSHTSARRQE